MAISEGGVRTIKVPTRPADQSRSVMDSIRQASVSSEDVSAIVHGMTVATNAILERKGARTALVTTEGFRDIIEIGRQNRPSLYDLTEDRPASLVPRDLRFTVSERTSPTGTITPLDGREVVEVVSKLREAGVEAIAVCLMFSFLHPEHERVLGDALRAVLDGVQVSLSSEVLPEFREFERFSTTVADAYLGPTLARYLRRLNDSLASAGMPRPLLMQSSGGATGIEHAAQRAASCVLSGPAGGVVGAAHVGRASGYEDLLTFDMGGTSTDVAVVMNGRVQTTTEAVVAGVPIKLPVVDVHSVSAGGGSIAWADEGGALRVGPQSAGADPGPACYQRGGIEPTVSDANLLLGYLADGALLGGEVTLSREASLKSLTRLSEALGMGVVEAASGVVEVANAEMARALRVISVERGLDPRDFSLMAFGGAGPLHACALADDLGIDTVLVPRACGVLSALGLAMSDERRDYVSAFLSRLDSSTSSRVERAFGRLERQAANDLQNPSCARRADLRYGGQSFELTVDVDDVVTLKEAFHRAHEQRYGYAMRNEVVELVNLRLVATLPVRKPTLIEGSPAAGGAQSGVRSAHFGEAWIVTAVYDRARMGVGSVVKGPVIVEFPEATCVVPPAWLGDIDAAGTLVLVRADK